MTLLPETKEILELVEKKTGKPVEIVSDPSLQLIAKVKRAKDKTPTHLLTYNPGKKEIDYTIAFECGFVLRLYENPPEERFDFGSNVSGRKTVRQMLTAPGGLAKRMRLPDAAVSELTETFFGGLMTQLRSMPIGMRIDQWLWDSYPGLGELQKLSIAKQQQDNVQTLSPQIKAMAPTRVFEANVAMNAAYAIFCDRLFGQQLYVIPCRRS